MVILWKMVYYLSSIIIFLKNYIKQEDKMDIPTIKEIKNYNINQLAELSDTIRKRLLEVVSREGGHLASNLGVVELTIALHKVFDTPNDKIIFDVGHQCYTHKILTGRNEQFAHLRKSNGVSGFPKCEESAFDTFSTGHSSTSISLMTGLIRARNLQNGNHRVVSVIGDGAFLGGQTFEALNDIGQLNGQGLIVLNDNEMTISKRVGAQIFSDEALKCLFENKNIVFAGSIDGHNIEKLVETFENLKNNKQITAIRVKTEKGKGFSDAEICPDKFHSVATEHCSSNQTYVLQKQFSKILSKIHQSDNKVVAVSPAMIDGVCLGDFQKEFPEFSIDVGICEEHAVSMCAGLAKGGMKPYLAVYSTFLQRAYDQTMIEICLNKMPVKICVDHAGLVEADGETHQGIYDISYLRTLPNLTMYAPKDVEEFEKVLSMPISTPISIRYPKSSIIFDLKSQETKKIVDDLKNKIETEHLVFDKEKEIVVLTCGIFTWQIGLAVQFVLNQLGMKNISVENATKLNSWTEFEIDKLKEKCVVSIEDNVLSGGFGSYIDELASKFGVKLSHLSVGIEKQVLAQGTIEELIETTGISPRCVSEKILNCCKMV